MEYSSKEWEMSSKIVYFSILINRLRWNQLMLLNFKSFINLEVITNTLGKLPVHFLKNIMFNFQLCKTITFHWSLCAFQMTAFCIPFPNKHFCLCWNPRCKLPVSKIFEKGDCQPGTKWFVWKAKERLGTMSCSLIRIYHLDFESRFTNS